MSSTAGAAPVVEVHDLVKKFDGLRALDGLSVTIPAGIIYGLLGPNGAGKTTLIRALIGLTRPDSGTVRVFGRPMPQDGPAVRARTGYMTQVPALYNELSVMENADFFARIFGLSDAGERKARIREVLDLVELTDRAGSPIHQLSGGLRQRASLACTLVPGPRLLLLDEPTVGVDPQLRYAFWTYFRRLADDGVTLIVSSHVMDEAERCDRLGLIRAGRVLAEGTAAGLRAQSGQPTLEAAFLALAGAQGVADPAAGPKEGK